MIDATALPPVPRKVRLSDHYLQNMRGAAALFIVVGLTLLVLFLYNAARKTSLAQHGMMVQGRVADQRVSEGKSTTYRIVVEFPFGGVSKSTTYDVSRSEYESSTYGAPFPVFVDRSDSSNNESHRLTSDDVNAWTLWWSLGLLAAGLIVVAGFYAGRREAEKQMERLSHWSLGQLQVKEVAAVAGNTQNLTVSGSFIDGAGQSRQVQSLVLSKGFEVGQPVPILYEPDGDAVVTLDSIKNAELC